MPLPYSFLLRFSNLTFMLMLGMAIFIMLLGYFIPTTANYAVIADAAFLYAGVGLLVKNGTFIYSKNVRFLNILFGLLILSVLLKLFHLPGANVLLILFFADIAILYAIWFFNKQEKKILDVLKVVWLPFFLASVLFKMLHWPYNVELYLTHLVLFITIQAIFISQNYQKLIKS